MGIADSRSDAHTTRDSRRFRVLLHEKKKRLRPHAHGREARVDLRATLLLRGALTKGWARHVSAHRARLVHHVTHHSPLPPSRSRPSPPPFQLDSRANGAPAAPPSRRTVSESVRSPRNISTRFSVLTFPFSSPHRSTRRAVHCRGAASPNLLHIVSLSSPAARVLVRRRPPFTRGLAATPGPSFPSSTSTVRLLNPPSVSSSLKKKKQQQQQHHPSHALTLSISADSVISVASSRRCLEATRVLWPHVAAHSRCRPPQVFFPLCDVRVAAHFTFLVGALGTLCIVGSLHGHHDSSSLVRQPRHRKQPPSHPLHPPASSQSRAASPPSVCGLF